MQALRHQDIKAGNDAQWQDVIGEGLCHHIELHIGFVERSTGKRAADQYCVVVVYFYTVNVTEQCRRQGEEARQDPN